VDIFVEKLVKKKLDGNDMLIIGGSIALAVVVISAIILFLGPYGASLILCLAVVYLTYMVISSRRIEYEYAFTNGELDIDKIVNKRKRENLISANCREFEIFAKADSEMAVSSLDSEDIYVFVAKKKIDEDEDRTKSKRVLVFFEPNEKMLKSIRLMIPGKVFE